MNKNSVKSVIVSVFFSEFIALFSLAVFAFFTYNKPDPSVYSSKLGIVTLLIGGLACGLISCFVSGRKNMALPIASGGTFCLIQLISSLLFSSGNFDLLLVAIKLILTMGIVTFTSYLITTKKTKHRKRKKR